MNRREESYTVHMLRLTAQYVYRGLVGHGLFSEKLPPIFTSEQFLSYCESNASVLYMSAPDASYGKELVRHYVHYESNRNNKDFRQLGIPNPFAHELLCRFIRDNWSKIQKHLVDYTKDENHRISRIHLRKFWNSPLLFKMNYKTMSERVKNPIISFLKRARYCVKADISSCFPSIYSHALAWAIAGKEEAKNHTGDYSQWYNWLDRYTRGMKYGETNGLIIGPHVSNLLSELILVIIDKHLYDKGFRFVRNIDDYDCYVETKEKAEEFIFYLSDELKQFSLLLNRKKTKILELPIGQDEGWVRRINSFKMLMPKERWSFDAVRGFLDYVVDLMKEDGDLAILSYSMKIVARADMTDDARGYYVSYMMHLALIYPYLYQFIDECLFQACNVPFREIAEFATQMYEHGLKSFNREEVIYALYFAVKYGFSIEGYSEDVIIRQNNAILDVMGYVYQTSRGCKALKLGELAREYGKGASESNRTLDQFWPLVYEINKSANIRNPDFAALKQAGVSFLRPLADIRVKYDPALEANFVDWMRHYKGPKHFVVVKDLLDKFRSKTRLRMLTNEYGEVLSCLLANFHAGVVGRYNLAIPRSLSYFDKYPIDLFTGKQLDGQIVRSLVDWLKCSQYIGEHIGGAGEGPTTYWAKDKLLLELRAIPTSEIVSEHIRSDVYVVLKNKRKEILWGAIHDGKADRYQAVLTDINKLLSKHKFECKSVLSGQYEEFSPVLRAIFNNSSWDEGGRLYAVLTKYGVNYQEVPSDLRPTIRIDGKDTIELDFASLHISMLYAQEGIVLNRDPYTIDGLSRAFVKKALLVILNADGRTSAIKSIENDKEAMSARVLLSSKKQALKSAYECVEDIDSALTAIESAHQPISQYFYSGHGIKMQSKDSEMALEIISSFKDQDIPVLPVHDSFIIQKEFKVLLRDVMDKTFKKYNNGYSCKIK